MSKKLRVVHYPQIPCKGFVVEVKDVREAKKIMDVLGLYDMFQYKNRIKSDYANSTILEQYNEDDQEWEDWYDYKTGIDDIEEYIEALKNKEKQLCILNSYDDNGNSIYFVSIHELNGIIFTTNRDEATVLEYEEAEAIRSHFGSRGQVWSIEY